MSFFSWKIMSIFASLGTSALVPFSLSTSSPLFGKASKTQVDSLQIPNNLSKVDILNSTSEAGGKGNRGGQFKVNSAELKNTANIIEGVEDEKSVPKKSINPNMMKYWGVKGTNISGTIASGTYTTNLACCNTKILGSFHRFLVNTQLNNYALRYSNIDSQLLFLQFPKDFRNTSEFLSKYSSSWIQTTWSSVFSAWPIKWSAQKLKNGSPSISYQTLRENRENLSLGSKYMIKQEIVDQIELPEENENVFLVEVPKYRLTPILTA